jgi:hypothetical protein
MDKDRGAGRLRGAFGQVRRNGSPAGAGAADGTRAQAGPAGPSAPVRRRRRRQKLGKRSRPGEYAQATGFVRHGVVERKDQALADPEVRRGLEAELSRNGVEFKAGDPDFGALCELLLVEWLDSVGYGVGEGR